MQTHIIIDSAKRGCLICKILSSYSILEDKDRCNRLYVELQTSVDDVVSQIKHPLKGNRIRRLLVNCPPTLDTLGYELCAFTTLGKSYKIS